MAAPNARVRRGGKVLTVLAAEVVRGDILELESGDLVAADARLIETASLQCVEAALTGESAPVLKAVSTLEAEAALAGTRRIWSHGDESCWGSSVEE
jgi:Ca2+-transporting ATPase